MLGCRAVLECIMSEVHGARGDRITAGKWASGKDSGLDCCHASNAACPALCAPPAGGKVLLRSLLLQAWAE